MKDAYTNLALSGVTVNVYSSSSVLVASGVTDVNGSYSLQFDAGNDYNVQFSKTGYMTVNYFGINVSGATYLETILQIDNVYSGYEYDSNIQAALDVDDISSYGPETITIHNQQPGVYRYSVYDYTNQDYSNNTVLANSGAQVKVYRNDVLVRTFYVPTGRIGTLWTVFELNGDTITPINTITYHDGYSGDVRSLQSHTDAGLMLNMPCK